MSTVPCNKVINGTYFTVLQCYMLYWPHCCKWLCFNIRGQLPNNIYGVSVVLRQFGVCICKTSGCKPFHDTFQKLKQLNTRILLVFTGWVNFGNKGIHCTVGKKKMLLMFTVPRSSGLKCITICWHITCLTATAFAHLVYVSLHRKPAGVTLFSFCVDGIFLHIAAVNVILTHLSQLL